MIYVDMDGVLADFEAHLKEMYGREYGEEMEDDFWNTRVVTDKPFLYMPAIAEGINMLFSLMLLEPAQQCCILTSTGGGKHHYEIARQKLSWLETQGLSGLPVAFCIGTKEQGRVRSAWRCPHR